MRFGCQIICEFLNSKNPDAYNNFRDRVKEGKKVRNTQALPSDTFVCT